MTAGRIIAVVAGLLIAAFAALLALGMAGGGHGWATPVFFSMGLFLAYPAVLLRLTALGRQWFVVDLGIVGLAAAADLALLSGTVNEGTEYFWRVVEMSAAFLILWLLIWFAWQPIALYCVGRDRAPRY